MERTKIDIISGFLGAGKTTLIKKLLKDAFKGEQVVLIENEFGEIGIDGGFLKEAGIEIREMNSGCICCSLVGDFGASLKEVISKYHPDRILIEPSGVGKLSDVIKAVQGVAEETGLVLNSYTTVVDAKKCKMYMRNFGEFFNNQVEYAGAIIMSRTDIVDEAKAQAAMELLREINPKAAIITTPIEKLEGAKILEVMEHPVSLEQEMMEEEVCPECGHVHEHGHHHHDHDHEEHEHHHDHDHEEHEHHHHDHDHEECSCGHDHDHDHHHDHDHDECGCGHIITIIMQTKFSQAGAVRQLRNTQEKILKRSLRHCLRQKNMESSFVRKECFRQKTEHGSTLIWFRKKQRSAAGHRNIQDVSA